MLNLQRMKEIDTSEMYKVYDDWPKIAEESFDADLEQLEYKNVDNIVFAGMGGSGSIGDIFTSILSKTELHSTTIKGYLLPNTINKNSLIVISSVSGNTTEVHNILQCAHKKKIRVVCFSSGGIIEEYCKKNQITHKRVDRIHSPRASFTKFLYSILKILQPNIPIRNNDVSESIQELKKLGNKINSRNLTNENPSLSLAEWITDIPLIYYPWGLQAAAIRFKSSLQENAKSHVIAEEVLEASHNGIVAWEKRSKIKPILIQGKDDYIKTKERWKIFKEYFNNNNIEYSEIFTKGDNILSKLTYLIYLSDYCSIYRSILSSIDPSPVSSIDFIKKKIQ
jgi:glucose/mannose-6-phosphate isomerase